MTRRVFTKVVVLAAIVAVAGAAVGFLITLALDAGITTRVVATVVGAVAGSVLGGVWGGEIGSMTEAQKEEGVVVGAHCDEREAADRALEVMRRHGPLRIDVYDDQGRSIAG